MDDRERELELELALRSKTQSQGQSTHTQTIDSRMPRAPSALSDIPAGLGSGLKDVGYGALQRVMELTGNPRAEFMRQNLVRERQAAAQAQATQPDTSLTYDVSKAVGSALPAIGLAAATGATSIPASAAIGTLSGYTRPSVSPTETTANTALEGTIAGGSAALSRFLFPRNMAEPEHLKSILAGRKEGMQYTGGMIADQPIIRRGEAHAVWNPLVKAHAIEQQNKMDDQFITSMLKQTGMPADKIAKNPSLDPDTLKGVASQIGARLDAPFKGKTVDLYTPRTITAITNAEKLAQELPEEDAKLVMAEVRRATNMANTGKLEGLEVQGKLRRMMETSGRLSEGIGGKGGNKESADIVKALHDDILDQSIPDAAARAAYNKAKGDYARFMTIEDTLRTSKMMGKGIPDRTKLATIIERSMPGGVIRDKSEMADLARAGQASAQLSALPDRAHEFLQFQDIPNAVSYARWNNPLAKFGLLHPQLRDAADLGRFIPGSYLTPGLITPEFTPAESKKP